MKKILFLLLFFLPINLYALSLSDLLTNSRLLIKDTSPTRQRYTDAQLTGFINSAQKDVINNTWVIIKSTTIILTSGTTYYSIPTDTLSVYRVTREGKNLPETSLQKLDGDAGNSAWDKAGGIPNSYFQDPTRTNRVGFYPWPNSSSSTGTVTFMYYAQGMDLSSASDVPFNSELRFYPYHELLQYFTAYRIYFLEGEMEKATLYREEYESRLAVMAGRIGMKQNFNPSFSAGEKR